MMNKEYKINQVGDIDATTEEGRLLCMALAMLTTEIHTDKTPSDVIAKLNKLKDEVYTDEGISG